MTDGLPQIRKMEYCHLTHKSFEIETFKIFKFLLTAHCWWDKWMNWNEGSNLNGVTSSTNFLLLALIFMGKSSTGLWGPPLFSSYLNRCCVTVAINIPLWNTCTMNTFCSRQHALRWAVETEFSKSVIVRRWPFRSSWTIWNSELGQWPWMKLKTVFNGFSQNDR